MRVKLPREALQYGFFVCETQIIFEGYINIKATRDVS